MIEVSNSRGKISDSHNTNPPLSHEIPSPSWPEGMNSLFEFSSAWVKNHSSSILFLESWVNILIPKSKHINQSWDFFQEVILTIYLFP